MRSEDISLGGLLLFGTICCAAVLVVAFVAPRPMLEGWLAAALFWSALPIGAVVLLMVMRLVPGIWREELMVFAEAATLLMPLAALLFVPALLGVTFLYPPPAGDAFRTVYAAPLFFALRTIAWFAVLLVLSRLVTRRTVPTATATIGLVAVLLLGMPIAVDWVVSRDPDFHSSGFPLYLLAMQVCVAMAWMVGAAAIGSPPLKKPQIAVGLLATALLVWCYFAFLPYFIDWSGNLPAAVAWYQRRGSGFWGATEVAMAVTALAPLLALIVFPVARSRRWLAGLCLVVLAGRGCEAAWLVMPDGPGHGVQPEIAFLVAFAGMALLFAACFQAMLRAHRRFRDAEATP